MTQPLKSYTNYRPSGITWLGDLPAHWDKKRLGVVCQLNPSKSEVTNLPMDLKISFVPMELLGENGEVSIEESRELGDVYQGFTYFKNGDVIVAKITPCFENGKGALANGLNNGIGMGTTELHVLRPEFIQGDFLYWITRVDAFRKIGATEMRGSAGQQRVPTEFIKNWTVGVPSKEEQTSIALFLNSTTTKLDELIVQKQRLIELLKEKRQALITQVVTKGLNPNVKMKDSGIPWLGRIPEHWEMKRLKFVSKNFTSGSRGWAEYYSDDGPIFIRIGNLKKGQIDLSLDDIQRVDVPDNAEAERTLLQQNDILVSITALIGAVGVVPENLGPAYINQHICLVRPSKEKVDPRWIAYCICEGPLQEQFNLITSGGTKLGLGLEDVKNLKILLPPLDEQKTIVRRLDELNASAEKTMTMLKDSITRLIEWRQSLISASVTGKIDLRKCSKIEPTANKTSFLPTELGK